MKQNPGQLCAGTWHKPEKYLKPLKALHRNNRNTRDPHSLRLLLLKRLIARLIFKSQYQMQILYLGGTADSK